MEGKHRAAQKFVMEGKRCAADERATQKAGGAVLDGLPTCFGIRVGARVASQQSPILRTDSKTYLAVSEYTKTIPQKRLFSGQ
jgi:hypothetical protein